MGLLRIKPVLQAWGRTLQGRVPSLSIEITKECPLRCPGCYAYEDAHLGTANLRSLSDFKGQELIARVLEVVDRHRPLHVSIVGGEVCRVNSSIRNLPLANWLRTHGTASRCQTRKRHPDIFVCRGLVQTWPEFWMDFRYFG
jgi:hypothetical protein